MISALTNVLRAGTVHISTSEGVFVEAAKMNAFLCVKAMPSQSQESNRVFAHISATRFGAVSRYTAYCCCSAYDTNTDFMRPPAKFQRIA